MQQQNKTALTVTAIASVLVLGGVVAVSFASGIRIPRLVNDPTAIGNVHPLTGMLSSLGIVLWGAAAAICFFTAACLHGPAERSTRAFLIASGLLSVWIELDDLFLIHEELAQSYLGLGERAVMLGWALLFLAYLGAFRKTIARSNWMFLLIACALLAGSVLCDTLLKTAMASMGDWRSLVEDGLKWMGICCWLAYYATTAYRLHQAVYAPGKQT